MKGFHGHIEKAALTNEDFRKVLYTSEHMQLVLMTLQPEEEIGSEVHTGNDQFFRFELGEGKCVIDGNEYHVKEGDVIIVPSGAQHNIINMSSTSELKMYTIYAPPHHKDSIVRATKKEAEEHEAEYDGEPTEHK